MPKVLVTGAAGQIGSELVPALRERYGEEAVVASDLDDREEQLAAPFARLDATDASAVARVVAEWKVDTIYHLAAVLSATGERNPKKAYDVNLGSLMAVLEVAKQGGCAVFCPSSIAAFGPGTPLEGTPQETIQRPSTMYGVTKVAGELLCDYYHAKFGVDTRGLRYPGLISYVTPPGGGTTDWAVDIFYQALQSGRYRCFLSADAQLDMMYMPDAIRAAIELMEADPERLRHRNAFNVTAMQLDPATLSAEIRRHIPDFVMEYDVDPVREAIARSWPRRVDDTAARQEWSWAPRYDRAAMTADMLEKLGARLGLYAAGADT